MFTGIIEATAKVLGRSSKGLLLDRPALFDDLTIGSSVSVSGVCLTVIELPPGHMRFEVVDETWRKTTLRMFETGSIVNLEHAVRAGDRLDGHVVQGHVEGTAVVASFELRKIGAEMTLRLPENLQKYVLPKGSMAIDGVSLTVDPRVVCSVALIPYTLEQTTLGSLKKGDIVNIETDVLIRAHAHAH